MIHARSRAAGTEVLDRLQDHVRAIDPDLPILSARMLSEQARGDLGNYEMAASALVMFGAMTIALSALGSTGWSHTRCGRARRRSASASPSARAVWTW